MLPATRICIGSYRGGLGIVNALLATYILLAIYLAEVNDIGKYVEKNLFI